VGVPKMFGHVPYYPYSWKSCYWGSVLDSRSKGHVQGPGILIAYLAA
jgi:hypothetical protein